MPRRALRRFKPKKGLSWETKSDAFVSKKPEDFPQTVSRPRPNPQDPAHDEMLSVSSEEPQPNYSTVTRTCGLLQMHSPFHWPPKSPMEIVEHNCRARGIHQRQGVVRAQHPKVNCGLETLTPNSLRDSRTSDLASRPRRTAKLFTE